MTEPVYKFNGWYGGSPATMSDGTYSRWSDFIIVAWNELSNTGIMQQEDSVGNMPILYQITRDPLGPNYYSLQTGPTKFQRIRVTSDTTICMNPEDQLVYWHIFTSVTEPPVADYNQMDPTAPDFIRNKPAIVKPDWAVTDVTSSSYIRNKPVISGGAVATQSNWAQVEPSHISFIQNKPTIPVVVQSNWAVSDTTSSAFILNKPALQTTTQVVLAGNVKNVYSIPANRSISYAGKGIAVGTPVVCFVSAKMDLRANRSKDTGLPIPCVGIVDYTTQIMTIGIIFNGGALVSSPDWAFVDSLSFGYMITPVT
jgi:hypothetical protein